MSDSITPTRQATIDGARRRALESLAFSRKIIHELLDGFPEDRMMWQRAEGEPHVLWMIGHLAVSDEWIRGMIGPCENPLPESYLRLFGHTSTPVSDASAYPPLREVLKHFKAGRQRLLDAVQEASAEALTRPLGEEGVGFAADPLDAVTKTAWHEGWHGGQLSGLRRALGLPGVFPD